MRRTSRIVSSLKIHSFRAEEEMLSGNSPFSFLDTVKGTRENTGDDSKSSSVEGTGNPLKSEYLLPVIVDDVLKDGKAEVKVLRSSDKWYGVTYKEDKESVMDALRSMKDKGLYPEALW